MLVIRFFRVGKKKQPSFKIVVTDSRRPPKAGRFVEEVGFYNPMTKEKVLRQERVKHWLDKGAQPSATVHNLLISSKILEGKKIAKHNIVKKKEEATEAVPETPKEGVSDAQQTTTKEPEQSKQEKAEPESVSQKTEEKQEEIKPENEKSEPIQHEEKKETEVGDQEQQEAPVAEEPKQ